MNHRLALIFACLLLLIQGTVLIQTRWVEDESWNTDVSVTWLREGRLRMSSFSADWAGVVDVRPPLTPLGMGTTFRLFGIGVVQARMFSLAAGLGTVLVVYWLALLLFGPLAAGLSAILTATDLYIVVGSRTARPEIHCALFCALGLLLYYRAQPKDSFPLALLSSLSIGAAINFHPLGMGFTVALGILLLIEFRARIFLQRRFWGLVAGFVLSILPMVFWITSSPAHKEAFRHVYLTRAAAPYGEKLAMEIYRYADFFGIGSQKVPLFGKLPLRLHLVLILLAAFAVLYRKNRRLAIELGIIVIVNLLWWTYQLNKASRYFALVLPALSIVVGAGIASAMALGRRWKLAALAAFFVYAGSQLAGNSLWLYKYRKADYNQVAKGLRAAIPPGSSVYGIITFYMALNDRTYYAYDRMPLDWALANVHPQYMILYDRVMMHGSGRGEDDFAGQREKVIAFVHGHADLVARVPNDFYGDLEVYKVR